MQFDLMPFGKKKSEQQISNFSVIWNSNNTNNNIIKDGMENSVTSFQYQP